MVKIKNTYKNSARVKELVNGATFVYNKDLCIVVNQLKSTVEIKDVAYLIYNFTKNTLMSLNGNSEVEVNEVEIFY